VLYLKTEWKPKNDIERERCFSSLNGVYCCFIGLSKTIKNEEDKILFITGVPAIASLSAMEFILTTNYDREISSLGGLKLKLEL